LAFKINFDNPGAVSSSAYGYDKLSVGFKNPQLLMSEDGLQLDFEKSKIDNGQASFRITP